MINTERDQCDRIVSNAKRSVWCTLQRDGHYESPVGHTHYHNLHFRVEIVTTDSTTILAAQMLRKQIIAWFETGNLSVKGTDLQEVADKLFVLICDRFGLHEVGIEIAAEGENGIFAHYPLTKPLQSLAI